MIQSLVLLFLFTTVFAGETLTYKDKSLKKKDAPAFLIQATPAGPDIDDVEYFFKEYSDGRKTYELKYDKKKKETSETYSSEGVFLEREEDIKFSSLTTAVKKAIKSYLNKRFSKFRIMETELRLTYDKKNYVDVEVSHEKGLTEISFTPEGEYVSEKEEPVNQIETQI